MTCNEGGILIVILGIPQRLCSFLVMSVLIISIGTISEACIYQGLTNSTIIDNETPSEIQTDDLEKPYNEEPSTEDATESRRLHRSRINAGPIYIALLHDSGVVEYRRQSGENSLLDWQGVVSIASGWHTVGLLADGTIIYYLEYGTNWWDPDLDVETWSDIIMVSANINITIGLRSNGTVVAAGYGYDGQCDTEEWSGITTISSGQYHTLGVRSDGTVVAVGANYDGECDVSSWGDIVAVACGESHSLGLRSDGTVIATGENNRGQCDVSEWRDIKMIAAGAWHSVGLRADGTVFATGLNILYEDLYYVEPVYLGQCDIMDWIGVVEIAAGGHCTIGLTSEGEILFAGVFANELPRY